MLGDLGFHLSKVVRKCNTHVNYLSWSVHFRGSVRHEAAGASASCPLKGSDPFSAAAYWAGHKLNVIWSKHSLSVPVYAKH